jgi:hypothetical protein
LDYTEFRRDETKETAAGFWLRAHAWVTGHGITRVLTDNESCYKSRLWHDTCTQLGVAVKKTRLTGPEPTARSNVSTAPSTTNGLTPSPALRHRRTTGSRVRDLSGQDS